MPDIFNASQPVQQMATTPSTASATPVAPVAAPAASQSAPRFGTSVERQQEALGQLMQQVRTTSSPFGAFATEPRNTSLDIQLPEENVLLLLRQHPVTQIKWVVIAIVLIFLPFFLIRTPFVNFLPANYQVVAVLGWFLLVLGFVMEAFLDWFYNISIVTNERIVDVEFASLLYKNVSSARLDRIEDVTSTNQGYLGSIFNYGNVLTQTAGAVDEFVFENVPHPDRVSAFINDLLEELPAPHEPNA